MDTQPGLEEAGVARDRLDLRPGDGTGDGVQVLGLPGVGLCGGVQVLRLLPPFPRQGVAARRRGPRSLLHQVVIESLWAVVEGGHLVELVLYH